MGQHRCVIELFAVKIVDDYEASCHDASATHDSTGCGGHDLIVELSVTACLQKMAENVIGQGWTRFAG